MSEPIDHPIVESNPTPKPSPFPISIENTEKKEIPPITATKIDKFSQTAKKLGFVKISKYSFEKVFWVVAWLQFLSATLMICIEYLSSVGLVWNVIAFTGLLISMIRSFNIVVVGAMIKFFSSLLDKKNADETVPEQII